VGIRNLLSPVVELGVLPGGASLRDAAMTVLKAPWAKAAFGFAETLLLGWATAVFTRLKVYWRT